MLFSALICQLSVTRGEGADASCLQIYDIWMNYIFIPYIISFSFIFTTTITVSSKALSLTSPGQDAEKNPLIL